MSGGYGDDDGDMFDSVDEEAEESEISADSEPEPQTPFRTISQAATPKSGVMRKRQLRTKPMSPKMRQKYPRVVSMLLTDENGRQLMFVRG